MPPERDHSGLSSISVRIRNRKYARITVMSKILWPFLPFGHLHSGFFFFFLNQLRCD